jgi:hypothetical protein
VRLASALRAEIKRFRAALQQSEVGLLDEELMGDGRRRLELVLQSYIYVGRVISESRFDSIDPFRSADDCDGLYVGLLPMGTLGAMRTIKAAHPVSIFTFSRVAEKDRFLLVMTDCHGRNAFGNIDEGTQDNVAYQRAQPELRGITVFKSVFGVPQDRARKLEQVFRQSVGVGHWIEILISTLPRTDASLAKT